MFVRIFHAGAPSAFAAFIVGVSFACLPGLPSNCGDSCTLLSVVLSKSPTATTPTGKSAAGSVKVMAASMIAVAETATTATFSLTLGSAPTGNVSVPVTSANTAKASVAPGVLVFAPASWNVPQFVTITGIDDLVLNGNQTIEVLIGPLTSSDLEFDGVDPADLAVVVIDNESPNVVIAESAGATGVSEYGAADVFTVVLTQPPAAPVNVVVLATAQASANASFVSANLVFTAGACPGPGDWCVPQNIVVAAQDDAVVEASHSTNFSFNVTSGDATYNGLSVSDVTVFISDNDRYLFRTAATHNGNFDNDATLGGNSDGAGIAEADAFCMADTNRPNTSTYKAMLVKAAPAPFRQATATANVGDAQNDWVLAANTGYYRTDGTTLIFATGANALFVFGTATNAPSTSAGDYWTGLRNDWRIQVGQNCSDWSTTGGNARTGSALATDTNVLNVGPQSCGLALHMLCAEQ